MQPTGMKQGSAPRFGVEEVLRRLDSVANPGVPIEEFLRVVVQCECGLLLTHKAFYTHPCDKIAARIANDAHDA